MRRSGTQMSEFVPDGPEETLADLFAETDGTVYLTNALASLNTTGE